MPQRPPSQCDIMNIALRNNNKKGLSTMSDDDSEPRSPQKNPATSDTVAIEWLHSKLEEIEKHCDADTLTIYGQLLPPLDHRVRLAIESLPHLRDSLLVIIDTPGGVVEVAERIVSTLRHHYHEVKFLIPDHAMSAGTVLVMSGDAILMDHFSRLGPVDPQLYIEGKPIATSVLSYLEQYERLVKKSEEGTLTSADLVLLQKLDLADLRQYELAAGLSVNLIREWLVRYKFKDWSTHSSTGQPVTPEEKSERAEEIARALNDQQKWGSHSRGIDRDVLTDLGLRIDNLESNGKLSDLVKEYFWFFRDFTYKMGYQNMAHSRCYL